jgi:metallo-beta-lactamase family protein
MSISIQVIGAARTVTGSRHLVRTARSTVLLDCGLYQGRRAEAHERNRHLGFDPTSLDAVVLSHAHIDHCGALPLLCKRGYTGPIYATPATRDLVAVMLADAAMIQAADARYLNRAISRHEAEADPIMPLYDQEDVEQVLQQMLTLPYHRSQVVAAGVTATFLDAGHVLGSAITLLDVDDEGQTRRVVFSGDLGRSGMPILRDPEIPSGAHALLLESTYGDRRHPPIQEMDDELAAVVNRTVSRGGKVIIPSFALERAQELVFALKRLRQRRLIPALPVVLDSPLTVSITDVFRMHPDCYDAETRQLLQEGDSPFELEGLRRTSSVAESIALDTSGAPVIIISASGMCEGGRVLHHLKAGVEDRRNTVLIVGFQAQHTLGRRLVERRPRVRIFGVERELHAEVVELGGFSAHADQRDLLAFAEAARQRGPLRHVILVHGEPRAQAGLAAALAAADFPDVRTPAPQEILSI